MGGTDWLPKGDGKDHKQPDNLPQSNESNGPDRMAEWLRQETTEPGVLGSNPPQVSECPTILPGLGGYPGSLSVKL